MFLSLVWVRIWTIKTKLMCMWIFMKGTILRKQQRRNLKTIQDRQELSVKMFEDFELISG